MSNINRTGADDQTAPHSRTDAARERVTHAYGTAKEKVSDTVGKVAERTTTAYETARERTGQAYTAAGEKAAATGRAAGAQIESNPLVALAGGLAVGVIAGALLPRTMREDAVLGPVGDRIKAAAGDAAQAAKVAGLDKLDELGLTPDAARDKVAGFAENARTAVGEVGAAAAGAVRS